MRPTPALVAYMRPRVASGLVSASRVEWTVSVLALEMPAKKRATTPTKKLRRPGRRGWLRDVAGNATTETVIMIPIIVVIWGGIAYTHQRYRKAINEGQLARAHVWQHAFAACEGGPPSGNTRIGESSDDSSG